MIDSAIVLKRLPPGWLIIVGVEHGAIAVVMLVLWLPSCHCVC